VDFATQRRTPKMSAGVYRALIANSGELPGSADRCNTG
jgi:hypothetical protein